MAAMTVHGVTVKHSTVNMLGSTIGLGLSREDHCMRVAEKHSYLFSAIAHDDMPSQVGLLLLRNCALPRFSYHLRITPPIIIRRAAEKFDERILIAAATKLALPLPFSDHPSTLSILRTSLTADGLGFRPHTRTSPAAYWSSFATSAYTIRGDHDIKSMEQFIENTDTHYHLADTYSVLFKSGINPSEKKNYSSFPPEFSQFWEFYSSSPTHKPHLQRHLSQLLDFHSYIKDENVLAPTMALHTLSNLPSDPDSPSKSFTSTSWWLTTAPTSEHTNISTYLFNAAIRHRYDLPPSDYLPDHCICGQSFASNSHFHCCEKFKKSSVNQRHELVVRTLIRYAHLAGITTRHEPPMPNEKGDRTRPDIWFFTVTKGAVYTDVSICCSYAASNLNSTDPIVVREREKDRMYKESCTRNHAQFTPFVMDSLGRFGTGATEIMNIIVGEYTWFYPLHTQHEVASFRQSMVAALSLRLQMGNGLVDIHGLAALHVCKPPIHPSLPLRPPSPIKHDTLHRPPSNLIEFQRHLDRPIRHRYPSPSSSSPSLASPSIPSSHIETDSKRTSGDQRSSPIEIDCETDNGSGGSEGKEEKLVVAAPGVRVVDQEVQSTLQLNFAVPIVHSIHPLPAPAPLFSLSTLSRRYRFEFRSINRKRTVVHIRKFPL
jgi:hypothetical protein